MFYLVLILCSFRSQIHPLLLRSIKENIWSLSCSVVPQPCLLGSFAGWQLVWDSRLHFLGMWFRSVSESHVYLFSLQTTCGQLAKQKFSVKKKKKKKDLSFSCPIYWLDLKSITSFEGFVFKLCTCFSFVTVLTDSSDVYFSIGWCEANEKADVYLQKYGLHL